MTPKHCAPSNILVELGNGSLILVFYRPPELSAARISAQPFSLTLRAAYYCTLTMLLRFVYGIGYKA